MGFTDRYIAIPILEIIEMEELDEDEGLGKEPMFHLEEVVKQSSIRISPFQIESYRPHYGIDEPYIDDWQYTLIRTRSGKDVLADLRVEEFEVLLNTDASE